MKKHDLIIISAAFMLFVVFLIIYLCFKNTESEIVQICYKNQVVYEFTYNETDNICIDINATDNIINITGSENKNITYNFNDDFYNKIEMKNGIIEMIDASCKNKYCMSMKLNKTLKTPIICTNGICVRFNKDDVKIYV